MKRHGLTTQDILIMQHVTKALEAPLHEELPDRPKSRFFVPMRQWLLRDYPEYESDRGLRAWAQYVYEKL